MIGSEIKKKIIIKLFFFPSKLFEGFWDFLRQHWTETVEKIFSRTFSEHPRSKRSSVDLEKSNPVLSRRLSSTGQPTREKGGKKNKWPIWTNQNEDCVVPSILHDIIFRIKWSEPFRKSCAFHFWLWLVQTGHVFFSISLIGFFLRKNLFLFLVINFFQWTSLISPSNH